MTQMGLSHGSRHGVILCKDTPSSAHFKRAQTTMWIWTIYGFLIWLQAKRWAISCKKSTNNNRDLTEANSWSHSKNVRIKLEPSPDWRGTFTIPDYLHDHIRMKHDPAWIISLPTLIKLMIRSCEGAPPIRTGFTFYPEVFRVFKLKFLTFLMWSAQS